MVKIYIQAKGDKSMTGKERVIRTMSYQEPDRVPLMEVAAGNKLATSILGRPANVFFSGDAIKNLVLMSKNVNHRKRKEFAENGYRDQLDFFSCLGIDAVPVMPGAYVLNSINPFGHSGSNDNEAIEIEELDGNTWKIMDDYGFWSIVKYVPSSDTAVITDHSLRYEGEKGVQRLVKIWKSKDYSRLPEAGQRQLVP